MKNGFQFIDNSIRAYESPYKRYERNISLLKTYVKGVPDSSLAPVSTNDYATRIKDLIRELDRKPSVCILGDFDSGKSTLVNALLGNDTIPTNITPTTSIPTFIKHIDDKPSWLEGDVVLLRRGFNPRLWKDLDHIKKYIILQGKTSILEEYVTHKKSKLDELIDLTAEQLLGERSDSGNESEYAIVFLDSPVLKACEIVDYPGFGNDDLDDERADSYTNSMDVSFYLSTITGFLQSYEIRRLGQILQSLDKFELVDPNFPTLGGLFVLATHADPSRYTDSLQNVALVATKRVFTQLGESKIRERQNVTGREIRPIDIASAMHVFWCERIKKHRTEMNQMYGSFIEDFDKLVKEHLPRFWDKRAEKLIGDFASSSTNALSRQIESYQNRLEEIKNLEQIYDGYMKREPDRKAKKSLKENAIRDSIRSFKDDSQSEFGSSYERILDEKNVESLIRDKYGDDKKDAKEYSMGYLLEKLEDAVKEILEPKTDHIKRQTDDFISDYVNASKLAGKSIDIGITIDGVSAFAAGLVGATGLGALAAWGAALGAAHIGSILAISSNATIAAIGSGLLSGASAAAAVSQGLAVAWTVATGPIGLGVIAGASLVLGAMKIFGPSWQLRLARKIKNELEKSGVKDQFNKSIRGYWDSTLSAFNEGAISIENEWLKKLEELRRQVEQPEEEGRKEIEGIIGGLKDLKDFFSSFQWGEEEAKC